jgi:hypothetical protein
MPSFFSNNIVNWHPTASIFANMREYHDNHAYMDYYSTPMKDVCLDNCSLFDGEKERCTRYCEEIQESFEESNRRTGAEFCRDKTCCKALAGTNDCAYVRCVQRMMARRVFPSSCSSFSRMLVILMIFTIFLFFLLQ